MTLTELLTPGQIELDLKSSDRWSAIVELTELLVAAGKVDAGDRQAILDELKKREESMSTGIGFGVAIPHASSDRVPTVVAAFGRSKGGVEFEALDGAPVHFIVLFVVPRDEFQVHLRTLAAIARFLNDRKVRERLGEADSPERVLEIFKENGAS